MKGLAVEIFFLGAIGMLRGALRARFEKYVVNILFEAAVGEHIAKSSEWPCLRQPPPCTILSAFGPCLQPSGQSTGLKPGY